MSQTILDLLTIVFPSVFGVGILTAIGACVKLWFECRKIRREALRIHKDEEYRSQINDLIQELKEERTERYKLEQKLNETMTLIDRIERK